MDILNAVSGIQIVYQLVCLSSCVIDRNSWTLRKSKLLESYAVIVIVASIVFLILSLMIEYNFVKLNKNALASNMDLIQLLGIRIAHIASTSEALIKSKQQTSFYLRVKIIDRIFERSFNVDVDNKKFGRTTMLHALLMTFVNFATEFFILASIILCDSKSLLLFRLLHLMPLLVCSIRYFQVFTSVCILKHRFDLLVTVLSRNNPTNPKSDIEDINVKDNVGVHNLTPLQSSLFHKNCCDMENPKLKLLLIARDVYNRLFNLSEIVNGCFGVSMLVNVANDFIAITCSFYWAFHIFHDFSSARYGFLQMVRSFIWSLPHIVNVVLLAILCENTVQKARKIALVLHGIILDVCNDNHNTVIQQFSLQLLHQKISITAAGFFIIDCTLLYTIVGSITTYLVILIQFQINESKSSD